MSGSPDADDLNLINSGLSKLTTNNNRQISINDDLYDGLNNMTNTINDLIREKDRTFTLTQSSNNLLKIILNLDILNEEIIKIQNSITLSKLGVVNNRMLRPIDTELINQILNDQGIPVDLLDQALGFASVAVGTDGETILYIISIPNPSNPSYQHLKIVPIIRYAVKEKFLYKFLIFLVFVQI